LPEEIELTEKQRIDFTAALQYMKTAKLILRDLELSRNDTKFYAKYKKEDILKWLESPSSPSSEKNLRDASNFMYDHSGHYKRLCNFFSEMSKLSYVVLPYKLDEDKLDVNKFKKKYKTTIDNLEVMSIKHEYQKVIATMVRDGISYNYEYSTNDSYYLRKLDPQYCTISSIEDGVLCVGFDFTYFNKYPEKLLQYGEEFVAKNEIYKANSKKRWQELDSSKAFALKMDESIDYNIPFFASLLPMLYDIEDYKALEKNSKEQDNYKLLSLDLPLTEDGNYKYDYNEAVKFYNMMASALPSWVGLVLSPMKVNEYAFNKSNTTNAIDTVANAESQFFRAAGVTELLFNSSKSSSATISSSIKTDEEIIFSIHRQVERVINKKLKQESGIYKFKLNIIDVTIFGMKDYLDNLLKASTYGAPLKLIICSMFGFSPSDTYGMTILEEILEIVDRWRPLQSSNTQNTGEGGRPEVDDNQLSDSGVKSREGDNRKQDA
jgi:hypothetical protein